MLSTSGNSKKAKIEPFEWIAEGEFHFFILNNLRMCSTIYDSPHRYPAQKRKQKRKLYASLTTVNETLC